MKGILLKDLYIAKSGIIITLTSLFVLTFGLSFLLDVTAILMLAPAVSTAAVYISITNDASSKWNKNVITMPVTRAQIIGTKYILYILLSAVGIIVVLVSLGALSLMGITVTLYSMLFNAAIGISVALLAGGISLPCVYFFDAEKSQIVYIISYWQFRLYGLLCPTKLLPTLIRKKILLDKNQYRKAPDAAACWPCARRFILRISEPVPTGI